MNKNPRLDLKKYHFIFTEIGFICTLLFLIAATNINVGSGNDSEIQDQRSIEPDKLIELPIPIPPEKLPPQKPMIFNEKPNDTVLEIDIPEFVDFDSYDPIIEVPKPESEPEEEVVDYLPFMPQIIGGQKELYSRIRYPKIARDINLEGRVMVQFVVDTDGNVTNPKIIRSVHPELDKEVLRVIKLVKFSPGVQNGRLVRVKMVQSVQFKLKR